MQLLWADDEIDLLKPHILFLNNKGYDVVTVTNGKDALEECKKKAFDAVLLDENMPGITGLETLNQIKAANPDAKVIMITKSEEESIMEDAIGSKIDDYLIKPVNPNQILLSLKKLLESRQLVSEKTSSAYMQDFRNIGMTIQDNLSFAEWSEVYKKLIFWELELQNSQDKSMEEILLNQKTEANNNFCKFVSKNYINFLNKPDAQTPVMSHNVIKKKLFPVLDGPDPVFFVLLDNLRFDQWKTLQPELANLFSLQSEDTFLSILPTATHYCRNSIFSGMMPSEMEKRFPTLWQNEEDEEGKNLHEEEFMNAQLQFNNRKDIKTSYTKITNFDAGKTLAANVGNLFQNKLNVIVYNFVDIISHARTEMNVIRELADDEAAYRSLTLSWFRHSPLYEALQKIAEKKVKLVITTDHGSVKVQNPVKIIGDKNTNTNLRYKTAKNLSYDRSEVFDIRNPQDGFLPKMHVSNTYAFCMNNDFFAYPNNYNYYANFYRNTFQHGGVSMEEMIIPFIVMQSK
jgi:CheY-like chemotaxis protein